MLRKLLGLRALQRILGVLDVYRSPEWSMSLGGAFNGQERRRLIFEAVCEQLRPELVAETGTHVGTTTEYMAERLVVPIHTVESHQRWFGYARHKLRKYPHVRVESGDSREFLRSLLEGGSLSEKRMLFYLDAHWGEDLPLGEELEIIFGNCRYAVVIVDDFEVPGDPGYQFDDYGKGKALTSAYIAATVERFGLSRFFPTARSEQETGKRRGCVVLAREGDAADALRRVSELQSRQ
jgi:hypothetical protein